MGLLLRPKHHNHFCDSYERSFTSTNVCSRCHPGPGYFEDDSPVEQFDHYGVFSRFRDGQDVAVPADEEDKFYADPKNAHLLNSENPYSMAYSLGVKIHF